MVVPPALQSLLEDMRRDPLPEAPLANPTGAFAVPPLGVGAGAAPVNLTQNTTITVTGASEPREVAGAVTRGQDRLNGDLVRNLQAATR